MTIYSEIASNKRRTWFVMILFAVFITTLAYVFARTSGYGYSVAAIALLISGLMSVGSYFFSDSMVLGISGAKQIKESDSPPLFHLVQNMTIASGLPMPKIYIIRDSSPNAFATGRDPKHAALAVTTGLLEKLDRAELEGVVAHEMSHIQNYDIRLMAVVTVLVGFVSLLSDWFVRSLWWGGDGDSGSDGKGSDRLELLLMLLGLALAILSPLIATLIQLAISRRREFLADASGAMMTRHPEGLASALEKIASDRRVPSFANNATAHLFIVNPFKGKDLASKLSGLFDTHPPISERITALRSM